MSTRVPEPKAAADFPAYTAVLPMQHASPSRPWVWIMGIVTGVILVPLLLCMIVGAVIGSAVLLWATHQVSAEVISSQTYTVLGSPLITIHDPSGNIHILAGPVNQVTVQTTKRARDSSQDLAQQALNTIKVSTSQTDNRITITGAISQDHPLSQHSIDLLITVPTSANLTIDLQAGDISLEHITGAFSLSVAAGNVIGDDLHAMGTSTVTVKAGTLRYSGDLASDATLGVIVNAGNADLYLPRNTPPTLDAATSVGNLTINDFALAVERHGVGASAQGDLATHHTGTLRVRISAGNMTISAIA